MKHLIIKKNKIFLVTIIFIFSLNFIFSQSDNQKDLNSWTTIGIEYKLNNKWEFSLEEQLRLKEDISVIDEEVSKYGLKMDKVIERNKWVSVKYLKYFLN